MVNKGLVTSTNTIVCGGEPLVQELKVETATNMYAGRLVKKGSTDNEIVLNTGQAPIGWLGYEQTAPAFKPSTKATIYVAEDKAAVLNGGHFYITTLLVDTSGNGCVKGDALMPASTLGGVKKFADTDPSTNGYMRVAVAEETITILEGDAPIPVVVRSLI